MILAAAQTAVDFVSGATAVACFAIAIFFLRFWQRSGDRLFGFFALAFLVFAGNRIVLTAVDDVSEAGTAVYVLRFLAFLVLALAILDKNRGDERR